MDSLWMLLVLAIVGLILTVDHYILRVKRHLNLPPVVDIPEDQMFRHPRQAYETALKDHGRIIRVLRRGRIEYIVDNTLVTDVLANEADFSFEKGTLSLLNMGILLHLPRSFVGNLDQLVYDEIIGKIELTMDKISPIFYRVIGEFQESVITAPSTAVDIANMVHKIMSEAMLTLIMGKEYTSEQNIDSVHHISREVAALAGIFDNTNTWARTFPTTWRICNWILIMCFSIPYYFFGIARQAYKELSQLGEDFDTHQDRKKGDQSVMFFFAQRYIDPETKKIGFLDKFWILFLLLGLIFASVHQTAVVMIWVILEIAKRPGDIPGLRKEIRTETCSDGTERLTYASLRNAERLDSFIREVMRMKGDTLSTVRLSVRDVKLAGFDIPKGSYVIPLASLSNRSQEYHGYDAEQFVSDRWVGTGKPAIMAGPGYYPFGLGRFACPGRTLAVSEIKLAVLLLIEHLTPTLVGGEYEVLDPLNVVSVAPKGKVLFVPLANESGKFTDQGTKSFHI